MAAHEQAVEKVIQHMQDNLTSWDTDLSLRALAHRGCYSRSHLIEVFERITGTTPHHFLTSLRIAKAKELLLNSAASVTHVALEVGYQSFPTFSRTFNHYVGMSPSVFRQMPSEMGISELIQAVGTFIAKNEASLSTETIGGHVCAPPNVRGVIFVGTFLTGGVPQGRPYSGTILLKPGAFRLPYPMSARLNPILRTGKKRSRPATFHLLAATVPTPLAASSTSHTITPTHVARLRVGGSDNRSVVLELRPVRVTDPPVVVSLSELLKDPDTNRNLG